MPNDPLLGSPESSAKEPEAHSAAPYRFRPPARFRVRRDPGEPQDALREGLEQVLPAALVQASDEAADRVTALSGPAGTDTEPGIEDASVRTFASTLAAALGSIAPATTASAIDSWLDRASNLRLVLVPRWLHPSINPHRQPKLVTMTSFANDRSRVVREAIDDSTPVLISRHGRIMAALIPLEPGAYEADVYKAAGQERLAAMREMTSIELDEKTAEEILTSDDPAAAASALGIDTTGWADLNPPR